MTSLPKRRPPSIEPIHDRAIHDIGLIRDAMDRAGTFTALPGWYMSALGVMVVPLAFLAYRLRSDRPAAWLSIWLAAAVLGAGSGVVATWAKARRLGLPLVTAPYRRFVILFGTPILAGALLTPALFRATGITLLPGTWLLLYGAGLVSGGLLTVPPVARTGAGFMLLGAAGLGSAAFGFSPAVGDALMALGFGGLHLALGLVIGSRHGG